MENEYEYEYDTATVKPDLLKLMNLFTLIYNKSAHHKSNLLDGVDPRIPNDTSEIQEEFNSIMVEHLKLEAADLNSTVVYKFDTNSETTTDTASSDTSKTYALTISSKPICYSKSKMALLICGSSLMTEDNGYGNNFDLISL
jgi:hypothetical protein